MRTKKKVSLTIDEDILDAVQKASRTRRIAKSQLAQEAFQLWLKKQTEALLAEGYEEEGDEDEEVAEFTLEAQKEILK